MERDALQRCRHPWSMDSHAETLELAAVEILRLRAQLAAARDAALEEAADYADLPMTLPAGHVMILDGDQCAAIAAGIRALKGPRHDP